MLLKNCQAKVAQNNRITNGLNSFKLVLKYNIHHLHVQRVELGYKLLKERRSSEHSCFDQNSHYKANVV
jgi:hypothetical protein